MRHQHAGLAIPDFPLAYGKLWPKTDGATLEAINRHRVDTRDFRSITAFQIWLQMTHRIGALAVLASAVVLAWTASRELGARTVFGRISIGLLGLIALQATLGAATVLSNKAADVATAHVVFGALSLVAGGVLRAMAMAQASGGARARTGYRAVTMRRFSDPSLVANTCQS